MLINIDEINKGLNKEQIEAVKEINGYVFNSAPPGSGKTFVLENRILWMATEHQIPTKNILAITFTNEAALEMRNRISERLKEFNIQNDVTATTFHSFAFKMIRNFGKGEVSKYFTLIDETDKHKIISQLLKGKENITNKNSTNLVKEYSNMISSYKSRGMTLGKLYNELKDNKERLDKYEDKELLKKDGLSQEDYEEQKLMQNYKVEEYQFYREYEMYKSSYSKEGKSSMLYDFDDLMLNLKLLLERKDIRKKISKIYNYILCDEAQDIDEVQRDILLLLSKDNGNLFCIFDDDQSIYSFRNADPNLILSMPDKVKNSKSIILRENFRSTKNIIEAANYLISNNKYRIYKWMYTNNQEGELLKYNSFTSKEKEADFICGEINKLKEKYKLNYSDFAVLYRNNDLNKSVEQRLIKNGIPYKINRNISFFQRKEIKDIVAYLEVLINNSVFYLERIFKVPPRGIGDKTFIQLKEKAISCGMTLMEVMELENKPKLNELCSLLRDLKEQSTKLSFKNLINYILEKTDYINKEFPENERETRKNNINNLINILNETERLFTDKTDCLAQLKIISGDDEEIGKEDKVSLMTIHSSKGKGFKVIFIIGCENGILPSFGALSDMQYEEERRLFYVGITRAKLLCYLSNVKYRRSYDGNIIPSEISPFLEEIPEDYLEVNNKEDLLTEF